jgi:dCMP deaminase
MTRYLVAYVPVLHGGYTKLMREHGGTLCLIAPPFVTDDYPRLIRDLRQLHVSDMVSAIRGLGVMEDVQVLDAALAMQIARERANVTLPDEDVSHTVADTYFSACAVTYKNVFLRWDKPITLTEQEIRPDQQITSDEADRVCMQAAAGEAPKSADWWRQIGAVAVRDGTVLFTEHNTYLPSDYNLFAAGNPRDNFDAGEHPEIYTAIHAEARIIARAARAGSSLLGTDIYVTTFPCANCARLLAEAGVHKIFYRDGYSRLDALDVLKVYGIDVIQVL